MRTALFWYTKDLRVEDLSGLAEACARYDRVISVYVWDAELMEGEAGNRMAFLLESLKDLSVQLESLGSALHFLRGTTGEQLISICRDYSITQVFCSDVRDPISVKLRAAVEAHLTTEGIALSVCTGNYLLQPDDIKTQTGSVYKVFTPYKNRVLQSLEAPSLAILRDAALSQEVRDLILPDVAMSHLSPERQKGGSAEAMKLWSRFKAESLNRYAEGRDELSNETGTSMLSAHLNFGTISARRIVRELMEIDDPALEVGKQSYLTELLWREFNYYIAHHFPASLYNSYRPELQELKWQRTPAQLEAWKEGMTGYPLVDAAMRQLKRTGWMHNRARMIVASFLVKDLLINWQEGEAHFMEWLTDGEQVQNNAGWQWSASTGVDAQPYFRIFNPIAQGKKFDASGDYVKRYVPELAFRAAKIIHQVNVVDGSSYPQAIVDHATQRDRALRMFKDAMDKYRN